MIEPNPGQLWRVNGSHALESGKMLPEGSVFLLLGPAKYHGYYQILYKEKIYSVYADFFLTGFFTFQK